MFKQPTVRLQLTISQAALDALVQKAKLLHLRSEKDAAELAIVEWVSKPVVPAEVVAGAEGRA